MKNFLFLFVICSFFAKSVNPPSIIFKENKGQWPVKVLFGTEYLNTKFYINKTGFNYCIYDFEELANAFMLKRNDFVVHGHNYEVNLVGANLNNFNMLNNVTEYFNYFIGSDATKWTDHVKACRKLEFQDIYKGIDLKVYSNLTNLKYDFIVSPNADPNLINLNYSFAEAVNVRNGELIVKTSVGEITEMSPLAFQIINNKKIEIKCEYLLKGNNVNFYFPDGYDKRYELIIDPVVLACSYGCAPVFSYCNASTYDPNGNIYTTGSSSIGYPTTMGSFQVNCTALKDIFISSFSSNGSSKLFSTFIGGNGYEYPIDIHVSESAITILGGSQSINYPVTANAFDVTQNGKYDLILSRLKIDGSNLLASTFVGGSDEENLDQFSPLIGGEMIVDKQKNIYIVSNTLSNDFPTTLGALSPAMSGSSDAVVFKMDSTLNMKWCTYLGGSQREMGQAIRTDALGGVYILGVTSSLDFPITLGAFSSSKSTFEDMYVSHINNSGTALIASTYVGTNTGDLGFVMDLDASNNVYIGGQVTSNGPSPNFIIPTAGTYSTNSLNTIYKIDSSLTSLSFKTLFGPTGTSTPHLEYTAIKVDSCGNIYFAGTAWIGHVTTPDRFQSFGYGATDIYMIVFNPNCSSVRFASYYGGSGNPPLGYANAGDQAWGKSHFDERGILYHAVTATQNFPTTANAYCSMYNDTTKVKPIFNDAFLKVDLGTFVNANSSYGANVIGCPPPFTGHFVSSTNNSSTYWDFGDGSTSLQDTISHTYSSLGTYSVLLVVTDTTTCNRTDSIKSIFNIVDPTFLDIGEVLYLCPDGNLILNANTSAVSYSWSTGETTQNISIDKPDTYSLTIFNGGCYSSDNVKVEIADNKLQQFPNVITPNSDGTNDNIDFTKFQLSEMEFIVYDRWGKERFKSINPTEKWEPSEFNNGTYFYVINYLSECNNKHASLKGFITLFK
jgi:gliding motility-associated-like protein